MIKNSKFVNVTRVHCLRSFSAVLMTVWFWCQVASRIAHLKYHPLGVLLNLKHLFAFSSLEHLAKWPMFWRSTCGFINSSFAWLEVSKISFILQLRALASHYLGQYFHNGLQGPSNKNEEMLCHKSDRTSDVGIHKYYWSHTGGTAWSVCINAHTVLDWRC